jgi:hypothetical protein
MAEQSGEGEEEECGEESVGANLAHAELALGGDDEDGNAEVTEGVAVDKIGKVGCGFAVLAEVDEGVGEGYYGEHLEEKDAEVDHVVGVKLGVAGGVEEDVAKSECGGIKRVPIAVEDSVPVVSTEKVAEVHVGYGVAIDLVGVEERVAEGDEGGEEAVERPETVQPVGETSGLRGSCSHAEGLPPFLLVSIIADAMGWPSKFR